MGPKRKQSATAEQEENGMVVLHRSSFIDWKPSPIISLASSQDDSLCAALRENGDIELYEIATLQLFQHIPGHIEASPTSIAIVDDGTGPSRIFVTGLDGNIVEVDTENGRLSSHVTDSYGGAVWQLAAEPKSIAAGTSNARKNTEPESRSKHKPTNTNEKDAHQSDDDNDDAVAIDNHRESAPPRIAAACDDGSVRIFTLSNNGLEYNKSLPRVEGRVLTVAWHPNGKHLISGGCDGCIHVWDIDTNREVFRITAGDGTGRELFIWSLLPLPDGTIVSGDSAGNVSFWEGSHGTLLNRFSHHAADVLQLAASDNGSTVFAAGVDPQIAVFQYVHHQNQQQWVYLASQRPHTHDVRALHSTGGKLFTGGNDTVLLVHSIDRFLKEHPKKVNACPQKPIFNIARIAATDNDDEKEEETYLMAAQQNCIDIWRLGIASMPPLTTQTKEGSQVLPMSMPMHVLKVVDKTGNHITSAALSSDGQYMAYSDAYRVVCFALIDTTSTGTADAKGAAARMLGIRPVILPCDLPPAVSLYFRPGSKELIALSADGIIRIFTMPSSSSSSGNVPSKKSNTSPLKIAETQPIAATLLCTNRELHDLRYKMWFKRDKAKNAARRLMPPVENTAPSFDGKWLAAVVRKRVHLVALESHRIAVSITPHGDQSTVTAIGFTPDSSSLVVVSPSNEISAFEIPSGHPSAWTLRHAVTLPKRVLKLPGPLAGIGCSPASPSAVVVYSSEAMCHVDLSVAVPSDPGTEGRRRRQRPRESMSGGVYGSMSSPQGQNARVLYCGDPVLYMQALGSKEVLVVERPWRDVFKMLAPPMYRHRYGT